MMLLCGAPDFGSEGGFSVCAGSFFMPFMIRDAHDDAVLLGVEQQGNNGGEDG